MLYFVVAALAAQAAAFPIYLGKRASNSTFALSSNSSVRPVTITNRTSVVWMTVTLPLELQVPSMTSLATSAASSTDTMVSVAPSAVTTRRTADNSGGVVSSPILNFTIYPNTTSTITSYITVTDGTFAAASGSGTGNGSKSGLGNGGGAANCACVPSTVTITITQEPQTQRTGSACCQADVPAAPVSVTTIYTTITASYPVSATFTMGDKITTITSSVTITTTQSSLSTSTLSANYVAPLKISYSNQTVPAQKPYGHLFNI